MKSGERIEAGESLVEILVTVVIMGLTVLAILAALWTAISASSYHRKEANADIVAKEYAEALRLMVSQMYADNWCSSTGYTPTGLTYPKDWGGTVTATFGSCPGKISANINTPQFQTATVTATAVGGTSATQTVILTPSWCYNSAASTC